MPPRLPRVALATSLALGLVLGSSAVASASTIVVATGTEAPALERRVEGRLGMLLGGSDVGDADGFSMGVAAGLGYRIGDVTLRALFDYYRVGDGNDERSGTGMAVRRGRASRLGGAVRYSFANTNETRSGSGVAVDFWGEAGLGLEHVAWRQGGVLDRPSGELAVGFEVDGQGARGRGDRRRHIGYFMAFRSLIGRGPESEGPAICAGPCTRATRPSRTDLSMFFELGVHWGR